MGWFWAERQSQGDLSGKSKCPVKHDNNIGNNLDSQGGCPVLQSESGSSCPVTNNDEINPMNNMPLSLSSEKAVGQKLVLPTERAISSIPKGYLEQEGLWQYPSPQQMFNAMIRKGKGQGIPEDAVESMVDIHNFLNEGAWQQVLSWEEKYAKETKIGPRLLKFTGRPHDLSPRAYMYLWLGSFFPQTFNTIPPFDRHDWTVLRSLGKDKGWKQVRYVIDYYSAPDDEETGMPSFVLDTRPALDDLNNAYDRFTHWFDPLYKRAMGNFIDQK